MNEVKARQRVPFIELIEKYSNSRIALIFNFLSILEMLAAGKIGIQVGEGFNNFWVTDASLQAAAENTETAL